MIGCDDLQFRVRIEPQVDFIQFGEKSKIFFWKTEDFNDIGQYKIQIQAVTDFGESQALKFTLTVSEPLFTEF